jgi:hypothetical protein
MMSTQRNLRNAVRKCKTESCERTVATDGARGLCSRCYAIVTRIEKQKSKPKLKSSRIPGVHEEKDIVLPIRRPFEFTGRGLDADIAQMNAEE